MHWSMANRESERPMAQIITYLIPRTTSQVVYIREPAYSNDPFSSIWKRIFGHISVTVEHDDGTLVKHLSSEAYTGEIGQGDVKRELQSSFTHNDIPIIVIDEYNVIKDSSVPHEMAETIKALSDDGVNVTVIVVGVSDSVSDLVRGHQSLIRCSEEVLLPRMGKTELMDLVEKRVAKLGMRMEGNAKWNIINLSKGLPSFGHSLGRGAVLATIDARRMTISEADIDIAISGIPRSSQNTLKEDYEVSTKSNQDRARFRQVLTACALAKSDDSGYFFPKQVQAPLNDFLRTVIDFPDFHKIIRDFTSDKRGTILQQKETDRQFRYRFRNPAMQPFVIMKGIEEGFLNNEAKLALSSPEQHDLFASVSLQPSSRSRPSARH